MLAIIDNKLFTGTIVTVGSGKDYSTIAAAIAGTTGDLLILLDEGTYGNVVFTARKVYIKSVGSVLNTIIYGSSSNYALAASGGAQLYVEGCKILADLSLLWLSSSTIILSKCLVQCSNIAYMAGTSNTPSSVLRFLQCSFSLHFTGMGASSIFNGVSTTWNVSGSELNKCLVQETHDYSSFSILGWSTTGALLVQDYVIAAASGYGYNYGNELIALYDSFEISPVTASIKAAESQQFELLGIIGAAESEITTNIVWSSSDEAVATISSSGGVAIGIAEGEVTISVQILNDDDGYTTLDATAALSVTESTAELLTGEVTGITATTCVLTGRIVSIS